MKSILTCAMTLAALATLAAEVKIDFDTTTGPVKPVNGVGQPPMIGAPCSYPMMHYLKEAGVPYSRLHDVGGAYGQMRYVDIPNIFRDFDADETDPRNYDFCYTDSLIKALMKNGVEPFFRLGVTIENYVESGYSPYRVFPPKDYAKWARICERVIRHYTEGWANGFKYKIAYWEIWNEPENNPDDSKNPMFRGPFTEYMKLYGTVATHLKAKFPHLKIGGYGSCGFYAGVGAGQVAAAHSSPRMEYFVECAEKFLAEAKANKWPLDFFSYHSYSAPDEALRQVRFADELLNRHGYTADKCERIYNEWLPYVSHDNLGTALQAAGVATELIELQNGPCDVACIYDARCGIGNYAPLFNPMTYKPHKAYYAFTAFNELRKRGQSVKVTTDGTKGFHATAAKGKGTAAVMLSNDTDQEMPVRIDFGDWTFVQAFITDGKRTAEEVALPKALPPRSFVVITLGKVRLVQDVHGYNSWPMMQAIGGKLVCTYCRGAAHNITEGVRGVYARTSTDGGKSWSPEVQVVNEPDQGESTIGKGLDETGAMLLWVRSWGKQGLHHDLYRTTDGVKFERLAVLRLDPNPMQITDVFHVPGEGLVALWFAGYYKDDGTCSWGKLTSTDNGRTWKQETVEKGLRLADWPTEPSAAYLGNGRILVMARTEGGGKSQFQITSTDNGKTWKRTATNITKVGGTTPSLIYDKETGLVYHYIYHRGPGLVKRRVVDAGYIFDHPMDWPDYDVLAAGSRIPVDSGNANATQIGKTHYVTYYSGKHPDTAIYITESDVRDFTPPAR